MTEAELRALPVALDLETAGKAWGFGRTKSHQLARRGEFPAPVLRLGNAYRVTKADLLRSLGLDPAGDGRGGPAPPGPPADNTTANALPARRTTPDDNPTVRH
jgi:hypothetical protein